MIRRGLLTLFLITIGVAHSVALLWQPPSLFPPLFEAFWWGLSGLVVGAGLIERGKLRGEHHDYTQLAGWLYVMSWGFGFCVGLLSPQPTMMGAELLKVAIVFALLILVWPAGKSVRQSYTSSSTVSDIFSPGRSGRVPPRDSGQQNGPHLE